MSPKLIAACLALLPVAAAAEPSVPGSGVVATSAWTRVTAPGTNAVAVFVTLKSPVRDRLVAVTTPAAKQAELQLDTVENGAIVARTLPAGLGLPPGQPVPLQPGGYQITLTGLAKPLALNDTIPLHLTFQVSQPIDVTARVAAIGPSNPPAAK